MERKRDYEVAQTLGQKIEVDTKCRLHIFWGRDNGKEVEHVFDDIEPAIRQHQHVVEGYIGFKETIRGKTLSIPGESQVLDGLVRETMDLALKFLEPQLLVRTDEKEIQTRLDELKTIQKQLKSLIIKIGAVRNAYKIKFKNHLEKATIEVLKAEERKNYQIAAELYQATEGGLARLEDIARKLNGVGIRLQILLGEEKEVKKIIKHVYTRLHKFLVELQNNNNLTQNDLKRIASQVCGGKLNLINGLGNIWIPPYGQRVRSREVRRLKKLGEYAASGDRKKMQRALLGAYIKLRPVVKKMEDRRKPKAKRWIPR